VKVLTLSTYDLVGGAAIAAHRLHLGLRQEGVEAQMQVKYKDGDEFHVSGPKTFSEKFKTVIFSQLEALPLLRYPKRVRGPWTNAWLPHPLWDQQSIDEADLLHLHWVGGGFVAPSTMKSFSKPMVWTLHDMYPFTGGCHYAGECRGYEQNCGCCPQLSSQKKRDLSYFNMRRKIRAWRDANITVVTPSKWLGECAAQSNLFGRLRVEVIPNGLDMERFKPYERDHCCRLFGLDPQKQYILFGAMNATSDRRKGFHFLQPALAQIAQDNHLKDIELLVFGASEPNSPPNLGFRTHYMGRMHDDVALALLYSIADVAVLPSMEDNLPNVVVEALACGTPCVAFNIGGMADMIVHEKNGFLAMPFDSLELAHGIKWVLESRGRYDQLAENARSIAVERFELSKVSRRYISLYEELI